MSPLSAHTGECHVPANATIMRDSTLGTKCGRTDATGLEYEALSGCGADVA